MVCLISRLSSGVLSRLLLWMGLCHQHSYYQNHSWYVPFGPSMIEQPNSGFETFFCRKVNNSGYHILSLFWLKNRRKITMDDGLPVGSPKIFPPSVCTWFLKIWVWKIKFDELDFCLFQTWILQAPQAVKIQFIKLEFQTWFFKQSSADW